MNSVVWIESKKSLGEVIGIGADQFWVERIDQGQIKREWFDPSDLKPVNLALEIIRALLDCSAN